MACKSVGWSTPWKRFGGAGGQFSGWQSLGVSPIIIMMMKVRFPWKKQRMRLWTRRELQNSFELVVWDDGDLGVRSMAAAGELHLDQVHQRLSRVRQGKG